ncbi:hypothetical protein Q1M64_23905 [Sinorhizobium meliloti]|nr:hypothetical protein Q1M64_23905 [Sinorhizobium meliloti]
MALGNVVVATENGHDDQGGFHGHSSVQMMTTLVYGRPILSKEGQKPAGAETNCFSPLRGLIVVAAKLRRLAYWSRRSSALER